jgi:hypothetical protein
MIAQSVADILRHHVKLTVEGIDRMYLNVESRVAAPRSQPSMSTQVCIIITLRKPRERFASLWRQQLPSSLGAVGGALMLSATFADAPKGGLIGNGPGQEAFPWP